MTLSSSRQNQQGSVVLVALCFLAVLGIALASYLAVSKQAVTLSNRSYQRSLSAQLAEGGIDQGLWSFGWNNWSAWDKTTISGTAILHYPATTYNNGVVGRINLRVDRWDATVWNNFTAYKSTNHDIVWYQGVWYQCTHDDNGPTPPSDTPGNWISAPAPWNASANYQSNNIVVYEDAAYRCMQPNINIPPTNTTYTTYWTPLATPLDNWDSAANYAVDTVVLYNGMLYRCTTINSNKAPPNAIFWAGVPVIYSEGIAEPLSNPTSQVRTQLRALVAPAPLFPNAIAATSTVSITSGSPFGTVDSYNSSLTPTLSPYTYSATIAGESTIGSAVVMSGVVIKGYVSAPPTSSSPFAPNVNLAGSLKGPSSVIPIDPARINRSPNIPQFDLAKWSAAKSYRLYDITQATDGNLYICSSPNSNNPPPESGHWTPASSVGYPDASGTISIGDAGSPFPILYRVDDLDLSTNVLQINGPVILDVHGNITIIDGKIVVMPNGSAEIIFSGQLRVDNGVGGIDNTQTKDPKKLLLVHTGTSSPSGHYFKSTIRFYGAIYMPSCALTIDNPAVRIYGAISADQIKSPSRLRLHYDTSLRTTVFRSVDAPFAITEWRELTDPAEKIVFP